MEPNAGSPTRISTLEAGAKILYEEAIYTVAAKGRITLDIWVIMTEEGLVIELEGYDPKIQLY